MTCIFGMVSDGKIYMVGDSCSANSEYRSVSAIRKIVRYDSMLLGFCGSWRDLQIAQTYFTPEARPEGTSDLRYLVKYVADPLRDLFRDYESVGVESNKSTADSQILLGYRERIYTIETNFQVSARQDNIGSVGSGTYYALGAFTALARAGKAHPETLLTETLEIVAQYDPFVAGPFYVETL